MANRIDRAIAGVELLTRKIRALPGQPRPIGPGPTPGAEIGNGVIQGILDEQRRLRTLFESSQIHVEDVFQI